VAELLDDGLDGHEAEDIGTPAWASFGDLMAGVLGAFVLVLGAALVSQLDLAERLDAEQRQRQAEVARREALERALSGPLRDGRITLKDGRIGISGSVLFATGSDQLHPEGRTLLHTLARPLATYLAQRDEVLMVSGFTDDLVVAKRGAVRFEDNWELSAQRALTVVRTLMQEGLPPDAVFAAAFGPQQPVASNDTAAGRAQNRRVELSPTPRPTVARPASAP
jgi:flagellar motor protein MotB